MIVTKCPASNRGNSRRLASTALAGLLAVFAMAGSASAQNCLEDVAGDTNCTANDFGVSSVTVNEVLDDGCVGDGDTFQFNGEFNVAGGSPNRYDVGFYIGRDGNQALTGQCSVHIIPAGLSNSDGDTCGDYLGAGITVPVNNVTVTCNDSDGDGFFDLALCTAYDQNGNATCNGPADALPGTASKCDCLQIDTTLRTPHCTEDPTLCVDDGNACTDTVCNSRESGLGDFFGCSNNNNSDPCSDGLFCNGDDFCSGGACNGHEGDPCTGAGTCSVCSEANNNCFASSATVCRASAGVCDIAENCTGSSTTCPANDFVTGGTECRADQGICDVAESCTGSTASCPADGFANAGTECRASDGVCDPAETCTGSTGSCPANSFSNSSTVCRADQGVCDVAENCTGSTADCPANGFEPSGTACTSDGNVCTDDECDGSGNCENNDNTDPCNDGLFCTEGDVCSGGACGGSPVSCDDAINCTIDSCDEDANACENAPDDTVCDDGDPCTENTCSEVNGCIIDLICNDVCRSPGYWSTHSGAEKAGKSINVGQLVLDAAGGIEVCGQTITATVNGSGNVDGLGLSSNLEGLCMRAKGIKQRQLYRQLTAAALNCVMSNGTDCDDITARYIDVSFDDCNALCETGVVAEDGPSVGECVGELGCFNSGGQIVNGDCALGTCADQPEIYCGKDYGSCPDFNALPQECVAFEDNCHDAALCKEVIDVCPKSTPASSPKACHGARFNECTIDSCD